MGDTKEKILMTALQLFARDGYEAVSVRNIAEELDITKGALYRHYKNKRDIFDSIVERMIQMDAQRAREYQMPDEGYDAKPDAYGNTALKISRSIPLSSSGSGQKMRLHPDSGKC